MDLGDFTSETGLTIAENRGGIGDGVGDAVRGFVENQGAIFDAKTFEGPLAFAAAGGKEAEEEELFVRQARGGECREEGGRAGDRNDGNFVANGECDEAMAGVRDERHAGVANQSDAGTLFHGEYEFGSASQFVVLVIAHQRLVNFEVVEQFEGVARVFTGDLVDFFEDTKRAKGDVFEVADGSGDEVEEATRSLRRTLGMQLRIHRLKVSLARGELLKARATMEF